MADLLFRRLRKRRFDPGHVAEIGVFRAEQSNVYGWARAGVRTTLVEANPRMAQNIREHFAGKSNVSVHACAVSDTCGDVELIDLGESTHIRGLEVTPARVNEPGKSTGSNTIVTGAIPFDRIDDGTIDLVSIDIEGAEWFALKHMTSRPAVISVETHGKLYENPHMREIRSWMRCNNYTLWYKTKTDSVFVRRDGIRVTPMDWLRLCAMESLLRFRRFRYRLGRK